MDLAMVYRATNELEAQVIKGLLEVHNIPCILKSDAAHSAHPFTVDGMGEVTVWVNKPDAEMAQAFINRQENDV